MPFVSVSRSTALAVAAALLLVLVLAGHRLSRAGSASAPEIAAPLEPVKPAAATKKMLVVHVVGAVRRAGLYRLPDGSRIADAVRRAGGATRHADLAAINLAAPLVDGVQVLVPRRVAAGVAPPEETAEALPGRERRAPAAPSRACRRQRPRSSTSSPGWGRSPRRRSSTTGPRTVPSGRWTTSTRFRASARLGSSSCGIS